MRYLFDTNAIIYFLQGSDRLDGILSEIRLGKATPSVSVITRIELLSYPGLTSAEEKTINELLDLFEILEVNKSVADETIKLRRKYRLKVPDSIIAASAIVNNGTIITRDKRLFKSVNGLRAVNPFEKKQQ